MYFTDEPSIAKCLFYVACAVLVAAATVVVVVVEPIDSRTRTCSVNETARHYDNPDYHRDPCCEERQVALLGLHKNEAEFCRRLIVALLLGAVIGYERRSPDRPAGIRTMGLVSLGSALFTVCSAWAFTTGPQGWDASRISAAIPGGVGFLGSAVVFKGGEKGAVTGLTTAVSVWLSAALGVACGGGLYITAAYTVVLAVVLLRFGPSLHATRVGDDEREELLHEAQKVGLMSKDEFREQMQVLRAAQEQERRAELRGQLQAAGLLPGSAPGSVQQAALDAGDPRQRLLAADTAPAAHPAGSTLSATARRPRKGPSGLID